MSITKIIFTFEGKETTIECSKEDKMKDICQKYSSKIESNLDSLLFLYGGNQLNLESSFENQANSIDKSENKMIISVFKKEESDLECPKCGDKIKFNFEPLKDILSSNNNIIDNIAGIKLIIENIVKNSLVEVVNVQLKNVNTILNSINEEIKTNIETLKNIIKDKDIINKKVDNNETMNLNDFQNKSVISGILDVDINDIENGIILFNSDYDYDMDFYLEDKKVSLEKDFDNNWRLNYSFITTGKYAFWMVFNDIVTDMEGFFATGPNIYSLDFSLFDSTNLTNMRILFNKCKKLKEIKGFDKLNTSKVIDMEGLFQNCITLEYIDLSNFDTSNVTNMAFMFNHCNRLKEIKGLDKFITSKATTMEGMFQSCFKLEFIDVSSFDTSNVEKMNFMFVDCFKLKGIKGINKLNTKKVTNMTGMFENCLSLKYLNIENFDTSNVTNMSYMFNKCKKLKEIKGMDKFNTINLTTTYAMFQFCNEIEKIDLSGFDTSNVTNMSYMFNKCKKLKEIKGLNTFITKNVKDMARMFNECSELENLVLTSFETPNVTNFSSMFNKCNNLKYLNLLNFEINGTTKNMFGFENKNTCNFITNNEELLRLYNSNE